MMQHHEAVAHLHHRLHVVFHEQDRSAEAIPNPTLDVEPYMRVGKIAHRYVTPEQAKVLRHAIDNHRQVKKLLRA